jgi:hypothetical protein
VLTKIVLIVNRSTYWQDNILIAEADVTFFNSANALTSERAVNKLVTASNKVDI